jgi:hypothetical protein
MWIQVSERLPEASMDVLVWTGSVMVIARLVNDGGTQCWDSDDEVVDLFPPTHWMPLPEPPAD